MLKRVSIQNFKSLKDVTLDLQKVNLLIGPNNSGKTNFLKALVKFNDFFDENYSTLNENYFQKNPSNDIFIGLTFEGKPYKDLEENYISAVYQNYGQSSANYQLSLHLGRRVDAIQKESTRLPAVSSVMKAFAGIDYIYKPDPNKLTQPSILGTGAQSVNADASNLIAFFDFIRDDQPDAFARIRSDLQKCVPEFIEINFQNIPSNDDLVKQFGPGTYKRLGLTNGRQGVKYWADELSEGTLYFLALLCIINQPNPPKLLLLEEPEKGIHPRRIREVMNFIRRLVAEKDIQVIMTTHSPLLLDEFAESPEGVFVFYKEDNGATTVRNLLRDVIEPANQENERLGIPPVPYTEALGEYWTIGFLGGVPHETA